MKYLILFLISLSAFGQTSTPCPIVKGYDAMGVTTGRFCPGDPVIECTPVLENVSRQEVKLNNDGTVKCPAELDQARKIVAVKLIARADKFKRGSIKRNKCRIALAYASGWIDDKGFTEDQEDAMKVSFAQPYKALKENDVRKAKKLIGYITDPNYMDLRDDLLEILE